MSGAFKSIGRPAPRAAEQSSEPARMDDAMSLLNSLRAPKGKFVAGKRGKPVSGMSANEIMNNPKILNSIADQIEEHEKKHGDKALKGPQVHSMLTNAMGKAPSAPQARTVARKLNRMRKQQITKA